MIQAIKELGELKLQWEGKNITDLLPIFIDNPNQDGNYPKTLVIIFEKKEGKYTYGGIDIEDISESKIEKYLYKRGASQGPDETPTSKITEIEKTFNNKIKGWFKKKFDVNELFAYLNEALIDSEKKILNELKTKWEEIKSQLKRNQGVIVTIAIKENDYSLRYLGDFEEFKGELINSVKKKYQKISKKNHLCSICREIKEEIYGNALNDIFKFYTLDKPGYIAGGFQEKNAWKNAPLCLECTLKLKEGKKFLDTYLKGKLGGQQYYLIPKFLLGIKKGEDLVNAFFTYSVRREEILKNKTLKRISEDEKEILEILGELKDVLTYNFLFYKASNQAFKINLFIEDILPSRISTIFKVKKEIDDKEIFKSVEVKKGKYEDIEFRFDIFKQFVSSPKVFLEIVDKTFRGVRFEQDLLFSWLMNTIREKFIKNIYLKPLVLKAFSSFLFFKKLELLISKQYFKKGGKFMNELKKKAEGFFNDFFDTFYSPAHKAIFLLGSLTEKLLKIQFIERNSTPFRKHLKGLRMREEDVKALFPKIQNKLEEYGKNYYRSFESLISEYFLEAGKNWKISTDEINFYFILGMNLANEIFEKLGLKERKED